jgi:hypothetical protein
MLLLDSFVFRDAPSLLHATALFPGVSRRVSV